jgi:hypothetical protein
MAVIEFGLVDQDGHEPVLEPVQALFGQHTMHGRFQPAAPGDQFGPVPHHLRQLADLRWGDPAFG